MIGLDNCWTFGGENVDSHPMFHSCFVSLLQHLQKELLSYARRHAENGDNLSELIRTTTSDIEYPAWPAGKAPWAFEKGGSGVAPECVRARADNKPSDTKSGPAAPDNESQEVKLKKLGDYKPKNKEEAEQMMMIGRRMIELALKKSGVNPKVQRVLLAELEKINTNSK